MKLTIGIPNYNGGNLLKKTIISCKNIGLLDTEYEVIILDNCSTDNSELLVSSLKSNLKNLSFIKNDKNYGRIGNWNRVLEEAQGDYILFLMVGDILEKADYNSIIFSKLTNSDTCLVFSFLKGKDKIKNSHFAQKINTTLSAKEIQNISLETLGHNYGLPILQSFFLNKSIINKKDLRFDEEFPFLADLKFLQEYITAFDRIKFLDIANIIWGTGLGKFTFKSQLFMFRDFLSYYPGAFNKYLKRDINMFFFKSYLTLHVFFIYINNFRIGNKGFIFGEMLGFIKKDLGSIFYILVFIFEPFYIVYMFINFKTNFKYVIKF